MEPKSLKIEVYGIPEEVHRCPGCIHVQTLIKELELTATFIPVMSKTESGQITYDRNLIVDLAKRAGFPNLNIRYPVIFVNDQLQTNILKFKQKLLDSGVNPDLFD